MTSQEIRWNGKQVYVVSALTRNRRFHFYVAAYIGFLGVVVREAKNGMLLVKFHPNVYRAIPASCLAERDSIKIAHRT